MAEQTAARPFTAAAFNLYLKENKLMGSRCTGCGAVYLPPRAICPACQSNILEWVEMSGKAVLAGFTVIASGPTFMIKAGYGRDNPYISGIVELAEGPRMSARILGLDPRAPESIRIGAPLTVEFLEQGEAEARHTYLAFRS